MRKKFVTFLILTFVLGLSPVNFADAVSQNQINAEVQVVCPDSYGNWYSGSGTIIDSKGIILTNKHVVTDQYGGIIKTCFIGFIESINQEPNFGIQSSPNLAEVKYHTTSTDMDAAILYLDNTASKSYPYVDIWNSNSSTLQFGDKVEAIGFPSIGGSTITYTSGDFSGFGSTSDGTQNYFKTTTPLEHGNSGGAAYNPLGQFIGIPTMVVAGTLNSLSYILSVNSIKSWLSGVLGKNYQQEVIQQKPTIETPKVNIQNDITPPTQKYFSINFEALDNNNQMIYYGSRYGDSKGAIYEFSKIRFIWSENCASDSCINDNSGSIAGYYYYFGNNPNAIPKIDGKYIADNELIKKVTSTNTEVKIPEIFEVQEKVSNYFILQAKDEAGNVSNPLINFEYIYEKDNFKDIKSFDIRTASNKLVGNLKYPLLEESPGCQAFQFCKDGRILDYTVKTIYTNQDSLILYPNYGYEIDGLTYYISYGDDRWWTDKTRTGKTTKDKFVKISNIRSKEAVNIFLKPFENNVNSFLGKHFILQIVYKSGSKEIATADIDPDPHYSNQYRALLKFNPIDETLTNRLKGSILLQVEQNGEAYYVYPNDNKRYFLGRPTDAFNVMRKLGLGATHSFITSYTVYPSTVSGKILLDVEQNGEAYYIYPKDRKAYYLGRPADAFRIMRELGLGITNNDLGKIPAGNL